ncbi:SpoVR family protein [bacterium]|nr:SpoVR family protein [bacterium]
MYQTRFSTELKEWKYKIENIAKDFGLDFFPVIFEVLSFDQLNQAAAFGGFPTRYPHWKFGMEYEKLAKGYTYGLMKIYELVINNNPSYAYLMDTNPLVDQKLVMAHVYGHVDFFKNNFWFSHTNRKMIDEMGNHGNRIRSYMNKYGYEVVEDYLTCCLSIENLIDIHSPYFKRSETTIKEEFDDRSLSLKFKSKGYMDPYINPPDFVDAMKKKQEVKDKKISENPQKDVLLFLIEHAPIENWQRDVLAIVRNEAYYFAPQGMTKIMNEGWASYWHTKIMTSKILADSEIIDFAEHHAGTVATSKDSINPYKIGLEIFRDVEDRWNKGKFGKDYEDCPNYEQRLNWNKNLGLGQQKIFEIRKIYNDITFLDEFLTPELAEKLQLFSFWKNPYSANYEIYTREFEKVKATLLAQLTNLGNPNIEIIDGNFRNRTELLIKHSHEGTDLDTNYAKDTLKNLSIIWTRPVHLETFVNKTKTLYSWEDNKFLTTKI